VILFRHKQIVQLELVRQSSVISRINNYLLACPLNARSCPDQTADAIVGARPDAGGLLHTDLIILCLYASDVVGRLTRNECGRFFAYNLTPSNLRPKVHGLFPKITKARCLIALIDHCDNLLSTISYLDPIILVVNRFPGNPTSLLAVQ
jgi:hypothetical protein